MSNLVQHARIELARLTGEDPEFKNSILKAVEGFTTFDHSGGSAEVAIEIVNQLLQHRNITPLTDDPTEWEYHDEARWGAPGGIYQNRRFSEAFSTDGGKTYFLVSERARGGGTVYRSSSREEASA